MLGQEPAPLVGEQRPVGLDGVEQLLARTPQTLGECNRSSEEVHPHQRRFAALPRHVDLAVRLRLEQLADVGLQHVVGHPEPITGYSASLARKKQYSQSRLQIGPVGLARTWNWRRAVGVTHASCTTVSPLSSSPRDDFTRLG